jgi:hypothetical protein
LAFTIYGFDFVSKANSGKQQGEANKLDYRIEVCQMIIFLPLNCFIIYFYLCMRKSLNSFTAKSLDAQKN